MKVVAADVNKVRRFGITSCGQERMGIGLSLIEACVDDVRIESKGGARYLPFFLRKRLGEQGGSLAND